MKSERHQALIAQYLERVGEGKTAEIAALLELSTDRTRAILSHMEEVEALGANRNRRWKLKEN